jgi:hypothetical protein
LSFFPIGCSAKDHANLVEMFNTKGVSSVYAIWVVGSKFLDDGEKLDVLKELLLPNPSGRAIQYLAVTVNREQMINLIKDTTKKAIDAGVDVRWYDHFIFHSIILADPDKQTGWMHIESVFPPLADA